ncbi:RNA-splicing ligase RtcB [Adhaeribacter aerolatus]|uniref:3'-phosphate/5'-hydroxy nucleic acid ligase n=1 Tax=Adhaeribacter aerolatus TaxID=670289 RepID=A0A512B155_9BACT|nr:RtcB family protein [Adhaeribacter aerolatus]GEO05698.1 RNA-splicing ligase RtcB [Adhaeribacter aerolatus]
MAREKLKGKDILDLGYPEGKAIGLALNLMDKYYKSTAKDEQLAILNDLFHNPEKYRHHKKLEKLVQELDAEKNKLREIALTEGALDFKTYGAEYIEPGAVFQMETAMSLPVTVAGALMPDAHQGYGLPIGGVLATNNAVIPYGVGVDIGCRMCLTLYDLPVHTLDRDKAKLKQFLNDNTRFGAGKGFEKPMDDPIFARQEFKEIAVARANKDKAREQIGSSGSGNHFVEFGIAELSSEQNEFDLPAGSYLAVLSHSGSRGLGATIANHYTKLATQNRKLPPHARHLAWLDLDSEEGQEYWAAMTLAGDYASACHHQIHERLGKALGEKPLVMIENHHNFAWKEKLGDGREVIVHRKGATPAGKGVLGIIPGSMTSPGFIVRGKGVEEAVYSASHGAGRIMSRRQAMDTISAKDVKEILARHGVELIGGGLDEAPMAYKNIHHVMASQADLVEVLGTFTPRIVRMDR